VGRCSYRWRSPGWAQAGRALPLWLVVARFSGSSVKRCTCGRRAPRWATRLWGVALVAGGCRGGRRKSAALRFVPAVAGLGSAPVRHSPWYRRMPDWADFQKKALPLAAGGAGLAGSSMGRGPRSGQGVGWQATPVGHHSVRRWARHRLRDALGADWECHGESADLWSS